MLTFIASYYTYYTCEKKMEDDLDINAYRVDYLPYFAHVIDRLNLVEIINRIIDKKHSQADVNTGVFVKGMILNLISDEKFRLYRLPDFYQDKPLELLFPECKGLAAENFNEFRAGDVLMEIFEADPRKIFSAISQEAIKIYDLDKSILHVDTTSKTFFGAYENQIDTPITINRGHSKDHRPDLKQILFGKGVNQDGVALMGDVLSGNKSDKTFNKEWISKIRTFLNLKNDEKLTYIADSCLVTQENVNLLSKYNIDFISLVSDTFKLPIELKLKAIEDNDWNDIGQISKQKNSASFKIKSYLNEFCGGTYKFLVVKSSSLEKTKTKTIEKNVKKEDIELQKKIKSFERKTFFCEKDAKNESRIFIKKCKSKYYTIEASVNLLNNETKLSDKEKIKKKSQNSDKELYVVKFSLKKDEEKIKLEKELGSMFVLITSDLDLEDKEILVTYKGQHKVERGFKFLKNPTVIGNYCLKNPQRIYAFGFLLLITSIIYTLAERMLKIPLSDEKEKPLDALPHQKTRTPTGNAIKFIFSNILLINYKIGGKNVWKLSKPLNKNQKRVLSLVKLNENIFYEINNV